MKRTVKLCLIILIVLSLCACVQSKSSLLLKNLDYLTNAQSKGRLAGTKENENVAEYLQEKLISYGYESLIESSILVPFSATLPSNITVSASINGENLISGTDFIPPLGGNFSLQGTITQTENGFVAIDEQGTEQILFSQSSFRSGVSDATASQASANLSLTETGIQKLNNAVGKTATYECFSNADKINIPNVLGVMAGEDREKAVIIGAHFDHVGNVSSTNIQFSGALDNASGVACALEIARLIQNNETPPVDIVFAFWNAEDMGMQGSKAGSKLLENMYSSYGYINLDCIGLVGKENLAITTQNASFEACKFLEKNLLENGFSQVRLAEDEFMSSDHYNFTKNISVSFGNTMKDINDTIHSPTDTVQNLDVGLIENFAIALANTIIESSQHLADSSLLSGYALSTQEFNALSEGEKMAYQKDLEHEMPVNYFTKLPNGFTIESDKATYFTAIEEFQKLYPQISIMQKVGDYELACIYLYGTVPSEDSLFKDIEYGKLYPRTFNFDSISAMELFYKNGDEIVVYRKSVSIIPDKDSLENSFDFVEPTNEYENTYYCKYDGSDAIYMVYPDELNSITLTFGEVYIRGNGKIMMTNILNETSKLLTLWDVFNSVDIITLDN